jgi:hypothetical protein
MQPAAVGFAKHSATTCGDHSVVRLGQVVEHLFLYITKDIFAFAGKKLPYRAAQLVLDHMVRVHKRHIQPARQLSADGGFARTWKAHEDDAQGNLTLKKQLGKPWRHPKL